MSAIVVSGAIANRHDRAGAIWTRLSYALGLRKLGFEVYVVEQIGQADCVDAVRGPTSFARSENLAMFQQVMAQFGFAGRCALICGGGEQIYGFTYAQLLDLAETAACLVNLSARESHL
jgi:hypothetical protein